jgi:hypothetical protein
MKTFNEHLTEKVINEAFEYHLENNIPFDECVFRYGSDMYFSFVNHLRECYNNSLLENYEYSEDELELINSDLGEFVMYEGEMVPLDLIMEEETPELNKPKRGGPKKFFVHTRDPKTGNVKKVSFGDTTGLTVKYDNPERKKAFAARHNCSDANDKTTPKYWSCRINRYMAKTPAGRRGFW